MRRVAATFLLAGLLVLGLSTAAAADFGLKDLSVTFEDETGAPVTEPGSHPFAMTTAFDIETVIVPDGAIDPGTDEVVDGEVPDEELKDLTVGQMPGLAGSRLAAASCSRIDFATIEDSYPACPRASAVGIAAIRGEFNAYPVGENTSWHAPVYFLDTSPGAAATLGFVVGNVAVAFDVVVSPVPPYNLVVRLRATPQAALFYRSKVTLWGNPWSPAHDEVRGECVGSPIVQSSDPGSTGSCPVLVPEEVPALTEVPLLTLPRSCKGQLATRFDATSWQGSSYLGEALTAGMEGCAGLGFTADAAAKPTATQASSPSGLDFGIEVDDPGLTDATQNTQADIAKVEVALPEGLTANPSAAVGQGACTEAEYKAASLDDPGCPNGSKLGTVTVSTPLLEEPLTGSLYLATPHANPFDALLATYLVLRNERFGISIKQAGKIVPDPVTGQLTSVFDELPELPFSDLQVRFREGPRAPLATPAACGTYITRTLLTPSSGAAPLLSESSFDVTSGPGGSPCPAGTPFAPGFVAGSFANQAGAYSPFYMRFSRRDGEAEISRLDAVLPPGVVGKLAGLGRCSEAQIAAARANGGAAELASPSCPASSRVGHVLASAGVGPVLTEVTGQLYLAGPYGGDPLSIVSVVPAVAGPFDLGTVVVRTALDLDPTSAQVVVDGAVSDPIPTILEGIPLRVRELELYVDREGFTLNPTSCDEGHAWATLFAGTRRATLASRYQASGCAALRFKPRFRIKLRGGPRRGSHPALRAVVTPRPGQANFSRAAVTLPRSAFLDQAHIRTVCTRVQFAAGAGHGSQCPRGAIYGKARAWSPLLDAPAEGPVFLRSSSNKLPDLVVALKGPASAPVDVELSSRIDSVKIGRDGAGIRSIFTGIPDVPVSRFVLAMQGGQKGLIVNSGNLCRKPARNRARANLLGQNGRRQLTKPRVVSVKCAKQRKAKRKRNKKANRSHARAARASRAGTVR